MSSYATLKKYSLFLFQHQILTRPVPKPQPMQTSNKEVSRKLPLILTKFLIFFHYTEIIFRFARPFCFKTLSCFAKVFLSFTIVILGKVAYISMSQLLQVLHITFFSPFPSSSAATAATLFRLISLASSISLALITLASTTCEPSWLVFSVER